MEQLTILQNTTPEKQEAVAMHYEIMQAAKTVADSLLDLGRKLKRMRDTGRYKDLGFATFGDYTEAAVGIRQRQVYTYISVVETLPARLIEDNAAAGVTKLALLAKLGPEDREELTGEPLANITVAELKKLVEERDALNKQLSMFTQPLDDVEPVAEVVGIEEQISPEEIWQKAAEETRQAMEQEWEKERKRMDAEKTTAVNDATKAAEATAAAAIKKAVNEAKAAAKKDTAEQVAKAKADAMREAAAQQQEKDAAAIAEAKAAEEAAREQAAAAAKQMQLSTDEDSIRFVLLFEQLRGKVEEMQNLTATMRENGKAEQADKYTTALRRALEALRDDLEGGEA